MGRFPAGGHVGHLVFDDDAGRLGEGTVIQPHGARGVAAHDAVGVAQFQRAPRRHGLLPGLVFRGDESEGQRGEEAEAVLGGELLAAGVAHVGLKEVDALVVVGDAAHQRLAPAREVHARYALALVEEGEGGHVVGPGELAGVVQGRLPVEDDRSAGGRIVLGDGVGRLHINGRALFRAAPGVLQAEGELAVVQPVGRIGLLAVLGDAGESRGEGDQSLGGEPLRDGVQFLGEDEVRVELVGRALGEVAGREQGVRVRHEGVEVLRQAQFGGLRVVPVGDLLQDGGGVVGREHRGRGAVHVGEQGAHGHLVRCLDDVGAAADAGRQGRRFRQVEVQVGPVVDLVVFEGRVVPVVEPPDDGSVVGVAEGDEVAGPVGAARDVEIGVEGLGEVLEQQGEPVVVGVAHRVGPCPVLGDGRRRDDRAPGLLVAVGDVGHFQDVGGGDVLRQFGRVAHAVMGRQVHLGPSLEAGLGRDDDDAVGALGAEDGRR